MKVTMFCPKKKQLICELFGNNIVEYVFLNPCIIWGLNKSNLSGDETKRFHFLNMYIMHLICFCVPMNKLFLFEYLKKRSQETDSAAVAIKRIRFLSI